MARLILPALFVVLWSTGFLGARLGGPHAEPFEFLALRFAIAAVLLGVVCLTTRAPWPGAREAGWIAVAGLLTHGVMLGGVFSAVRGGMPLGVVALIGGLQPVLTAVATRALFGEHLRGVQWAGVALGFAGVVLVASGKIEAGRITAAGLVFSFLAVTGMTAGTLVQKRFCTAADLRSTGVIQYVAAFVLMAAGSFAFESQPIDWTPAFLFALSWLVLVNSIIAIALLYVMVARSSVNQVSSLFYLTPSVTAVFAWLLFREPITLPMAAGIAVSSAGVFLAVRSGSPPDSADESALA